MAQVRRVSSAPEGQPPPICTLITEVQQASDRRFAANPLRFQWVRLGLAIDSVLDLSMQSREEMCMDGEPTTPPELGDEGAQGLLQQIFEIWINPEVARRIAARTLVAPVNLLFAQVIMNVGKPTRVRLNDEVRARLLVRVTRDVERGTAVQYGDYDHVQAIELTDDDPNAAHVTIARVKDQWAITFDFRYNAELVSQTLAAASEFLEIAELALARKHLRAFMENLFAAAELVAKSWLLMTPDERVMNTKKHPFIKARINKEAKLGNVDGDFARVLNKLDSQRENARYVKGEVAVSDEEMSRMATVVRSSFEQTRQRAPKRRSRYDASVDASHDNDSDSATVTEISQTDA